MMGLLRCLNNLFQLILLLALLLMVSCFSVQCKSQKNESTLVSRIENSIVPITKSGADTLPSQSLRSRMNELGVAGLSVAVFYQGQILWARGYGYSNKSLLQHVDTTTVFQAASLSKPVTSIGMFKLMEKNLIEIEEDVNV